MLVCLARRRNAEAQQRRDSQRESVRRGPTAGRELRSPKREAAAGGLLTGGRQQPRNGDVPARRGQARRDLAVAALPRGFGLRSECGQQKRAPAFDLSGVGEVARCLNATEMGAPLRP